MSEQMLKFALAILAAAALGPVLANAQETTTESSNKAKIEDVTESQNKAPGDVDEVLTNNQMRAQSGSKSKYSVSTFWSYQGGSIQSPMSEQRPNIAQAPGLTPFSTLAGDISGKYNFDQTHSVMVGAGLRYVTPFQRSAPPGQLKADGTKAYKGQKFDIDNPYVTGQYVYNTAGVQNILTFTPTFYTNSDLVKAGYVSQLALQQISGYEIGHSGFTAGIAAAIVQDIYATFDPTQIDSSLQFDPYFEYQLTDKINLRTVLNFVNFDHKRGSGMDTWVHEPNIESVGVGFSITRDIFLYPNVQFNIDNLRADLTNVGVQSYINIF